MSPLYKVRDFKVEDTTLVGVSLGWQGVVDPSAKEEDGDTPMLGGDGEYKIANLFPAGSMMNMVKLLTFYRNGPFELKAQHADDGPLLPKQSKELGTYRIEVPAQTEARKIKVKAKMSLNGIFTVEGAQMLLEDEYEETVKEKREIPAEADAKPEGEKAEGEAAADAKPEEPAKEAEKKFEWVDVVQKKVKITRVDLVVTSTGKVGMSADLVQKKMAEEAKMQADMKDILESDEKRNDLESYIFNMRDKIEPGREYGDYISEKDREKFKKLLTGAEDWLYDAENPTKTQFIDKLAEMKEAGEPVVWRHKESSQRDDWSKAIKGTVINYLNAVENPGDKYGHIAVDKRNKIKTACKELEKWLADKTEKQEKMPKSDKPCLTCTDMEKKNQDLSKMANDILKEPKPPPPKPPPKVEKPKEEKPKEEKKPPAEAPKEETNNADAAPKEAAASEAPKEDAPAAESPKKPKPEGPENMDVD